MKWLQDNASWFFSGIGVVVLSAVGYFVKRFLEKSGNGQQQKADRGSLAIQAGRDVQIGQGNKQESQ